MVFGFGAEKEEEVDPNKEIFVIELYGGREITDPKTKNSKDGPAFLDLYCTMKMGKQRYETPVIKHSMNPVWNLQYEFDLDDITDVAVVNINVYSQGVLGRDFIGEVRIPVAEHQDVAFGYAVQHWFPLYNPKLKKKDGSPGELGLKIGMKGGAKRTSEYDRSYEDRSVEEIYEEANSLASESNASAQRSLRLIEQTREIGASTMMRLRDQGTQIEQMQSDMDTVHNNMKQSERKLRSIESVWGTMANTVTSSSNSRYKKKADADRKLLRKRRKEEKKSLKIREQQWKERREADAFNGRARDGMIARDPGSRNEEGSQEQQFYQTVDDTDQALDRIGNVLDDLKIIARDMGTELNEQNQRLDSLRYDVEKAQPRMDNSIKRARAICN